jgi:hypothetical protein
MQEIYDPHLKISKYQWGEPEATAHMKKMTPGENKNMGWFFLERNSISLKNSLDSKRSFCILKS